MKKRKLDKRVLAVGEVTGHAHRVDVDVYELEDGVREFSGPTRVSHEEHRMFALAADDYYADRVVETDHFAEEARRVAD